MRSDAEFRVEIIGESGPFTDSEMIAITTIAASLYAANGSEGLGEAFKRAVAAYHEMSGYMRRIQPSDGPGQDVMNPRAPLEGFRIERDGEGSKVVTFRKVDVRRGVPQ